MIQAGVPGKPPKKAASPAESKSPPARPQSFAGSLLPSTLRTALGNLRRHKMRSMLTALGVIIGVAAVVAMTEIGQGTKAVIEKTIASLGAYGLIIHPWAVNNAGVNQGAGTFQSLKPTDVDEIARQCPSIVVAVPMVGAWGAQAVYGRLNWAPQQITGTAPSYLAISDREDLEEGNCFSDRQRPHRQRGLPDRRHGQARAVRRRIADRQDNPHPQCPLSRHRALAAAGREHGGPGPGRLYYRPLDDDQVPRQQLGAGSTKPAAAAVARRSIP